MFMRSSRMMLAEVDIPTVNPWGCVLQMGVQRGDLGA